MNSKNSLSGKNSSGRTSGGRSSRPSSTIFYKLRELDRKISEIDNQLKAMGYYNWMSYNINSVVTKLRRRREKLDLKRKEVRVVSSSTKF